MAVDAKTDDLIYPVAMSTVPAWRAGFEVEVILGDLGDPRFEENAADAWPPLQRPIVAGSLRPCGAIRDVITVLLELREPLDAFGVDSRIESILPHLRAAEDIDLRITLSTRRVPGSSSTCGCRTGRSAVAQTEAGSR